MVCDKNFIEERKCVFYFRVKCNKDHSKSEQSNNDGFPETCEKTCKENRLIGETNLFSQFSVNVNSPLSNEDLNDDTGSIMHDVSASFSSSQCSQEKYVTVVNESPEIDKISSFEHNLKDVDNVAYNSKNGLYRLYMEGLRSKDCSLLSLEGKESKMETRRTDGVDMLSMIRLQELYKGPDDHKHLEKFNLNASASESLRLTSVKNDFIKSFQPVEIQVNYLEAKLHPHRIHGIPWKYMNNEWYRLMSFVKFPIDLPVSTIRLASEGFAYLNNFHMIICVFCTTKLKTFNDIDNIDEEHKNLGLDCPMVKGTHSNNIPMEQRFPDMNADDIFSKLLASRQNASQIKQSNTSPATPLIKDYNSDDVRSSQPSDESAPYVLVTNFSDLEESDSNVQQSSQIMEDSTSPQVQEDVTSQLSNVPQTTESAVVQSNATVESSSAEQPNSNQLEKPKESKEAADESAADTTSYEKLRIITARPKRVEYAVYSIRFNSFNDWPKDHHMKPVDLAKAGYFYTGYSDCARCFYCGGGLRNWEQQDDVWVEHARWFPKCAFLLQEVGKDFIDTVQTLSKDRDEIKYNDVIQRMQGSDVTTPLKFKERVIEQDPAVLSLIDNGFDKDQIIKLAQETRKSGELISSEKLYETAMARNFPQKDCINNLGSDSVSIRKGGNVKRDKETIETLRYDNNELRQQTLCKICMDMEVAVVFLPCGHLVSCTECSCALTVCPVCRFGIKGIVRAYIG